jgi:hypothetical protein
VSYIEAKQIALEVFKNNAVQLAEIAREAGRKRAEELTDDFLKVLQERNPEGVKKAIEPDFQLALLDAQRAYARTGDRDLSRVLIDLLVSRSAEKTRSLREIVLTESLQVIPRLTIQQINTISVVFILKHTRNFQVTSLDALKAWFGRVVQPFVSSLTKADTCYQHLAYSGAATIELTSARLGMILRENYPGLFSTGYPIEEYQKQIKAYPGFEDLLVPAFHAPNNVQLAPLFEEQTRQRLDAIHVPKPVQDELWKKHLNSRKSEGDVETHASDNIPGFRELLDVWAGSSLRSLSLTSVGVAIGHGNFVHITGERAPLSIWIPD